MSAVQRLVALIVCFGLGLAVCGVVLFNRSTAVNPSQALPIDDESDAQYVDVTLASKDATPEQVVTQQLNSLQASLTDPSQLKTCYSLASPENRKLTGPFNRFAAMVMQPPYDQLARCTTWQVGSAEIEEDYAAVLVSTINNREQPQAFRFLLRLHGRAPYEGCWLTDAVQVLQPMNELSSGPAQSNKEPKID